MLSDLKQRASKAKDASVSKITHTRDHMKSQPSKKLDWDKAPPPPPPPVVRPKNQFAPPPSRTSSAVSQSSSPPVSSPPVPPPAIPGRPPPVRRQTRPDSVSPPIPSGPPPIPPTRSVSRIVSARVHEGPEEIEEDTIDWANLSQEDKDVFFSWLDEFFARFLSSPTQPRSAHGSTKTIQAPQPAPIAPKPQFANNGPPPIPKWTRPSQPFPAQEAANDEEQLDMSYPPPTQHGSSALDLAYYFSPSTYWDSDWYATNDPWCAPPLKDRKDTRRAGYMEHTGDASGIFRIVFGGVLFADLSACWYSVTFPHNTPTDPNDTRTVKRVAQYLPRPTAMDREALLEAHETYGETIAAFAEGFVDSGEYCARGECWDLANQALEYCSQFDYVQKPVQSTYRTHGHLIFEGKALGKGRQYGRWRGGDDRVRRGDIVEWRSVAVSMKMDWGVGTGKLGNPDHTAVIVNDMVPSVQVADGQSVTPGELGILDVVEQSVSTNIKPKRSTYLLSGLEAGEMWIYRPVSMMAYVGCMVEAKVPEGVSAQTI